MTQLIFDAISPVSMTADRFNKLNDNIEDLNELMLQYSLRSDKFKLFDNIHFGLSHLAKDGLHLNSSGKTVLSAIWVNCILIRLGIRRGSLPLRHKFLRMYDAYNNNVG